MAIDTLMDRNRIFAVETRTRKGDPASSGIVAALMALALPVLVAGQNPPVRVPDDLRANADSPNVYLNENLEAAEQLARLQRMTESGEWSGAVELARDLMDRHGAELVRVDDGLFECVARHVNRRLASWPPAGIDAYRRVVDDEARLMLEELKRSPDLEAALLALDRYAFSTHMRALAAWIAERAIEQGRFELAIHTYRRTLALSPDGEDIRADAAPLLAVAFAYLGHTAAADHWAQVAGAAGDGNTDRFRLLREQSAYRDPARESAREWPTFGGDATRNSMARLDLGQAASLWEFSLTAKAAADEDKPGESMFQELALNSTLPPMIQSLPPVIAEGRIYVQNASQIWAVDLVSGAPIWTFAHAPEINALLLQAGNAPLWHSPTAHQQQVLAAFSGGPCGDEDDLDENDGQPQRDCRPALLCLNGRDGRVIWRVRQQDLGSHWDEKFFDASPLVVGHTVVAVVRRQRVFGFEDCYLYGFDLTTGRERYQVHLGGCSAGGFGYRRPTLSIPASDGDSIYVTTNIGTLACVSADTGRVRWLRIYPQAVRSGPLAGGRGLPIDLKPWNYSPTLWSESTPGPDPETNPAAPQDIWPQATLICSPLDSGALWFLQASTGAVQHQVPRSQLPPETTLVGVREGVLYASAMRPFAYDLATSTFRWTVELPGDEEIVGHSLLTAEGLYVPTNRSLLRLALQTGELFSSRWDSVDEAGGSLVAYEDQLFTANPLRVAAYASRDKVFAALEKRLREFPSDPEAALDMTDIAIRNQERVMAMQALDEAIRRIGGFAQLMDPAQKRRLFELCITFAMSLDKTVRAAQKPETEALAEAPEPVMPAPIHFSYPAETAALIHQLYRYASQCAPDLASELVYRFRWAEFHLNNKAPGDAVGLYQQIIADRSLREAPPPFARMEDLVPSESRAGLARLSAGVVAEKLIDRLIHQFGREVYAAFEKAASEKLDAAQRVNEGEAFDGVIVTFPNSTSATRAWVAKADRLRADGRHREAVTAYVNALGRYPQVTATAETPRPEIIRRIADACLEDGRVGEAWRWLVKGEREHPDSIVEGEGRRLSLREYRLWRLPQGEDDRGAIPRLRLPLVESFTREFENEVGLLDPIFPDVCKGGWRHALVYSAKQVNLLDPGSGEPIWPAPQAFAEKPELLLTSPSSLVLATAHRISAHQHQTGELLWSVGETPANLDDPGVDHEDTVRWTVMGTDGVRLAAADSDGVTTAIELTDGRVLWRERMDPAPTGRFLVTDDWVIYPGLQRNRTVYGMVDIRTGETIRVLDPEDDRQAVSLAVTLDGMILLVNSQAIYAYDPNSGVQRWRRQFQGQLSEPGVVIDLDGLFVAVDGRDIEKIGLADGKGLWKAEARAERIRPRTSMRLAEGQLLVHNGESVYALDALDGRVRWEGTVPPGVDLETAHLLSGRYWAAIDDQHDGQNHRFDFYFYDYQQGGGRIPDQGGLLKLEGLPDGLFSLRDDALLFVSQRRLQGWSAR